MSDFKRISIAQAKQLILDNAVIADIRDEQSFLQGHMHGAYHLTNTSIGQFMREHDYATPVVVVCYHGNSSQGAARYLAEQGYEQVYSMDGGFESWRSQEPYTSASDTAHDA